MSETKKTHVTLVLDETGSMQPVKQSTIDGFNSYIDELRADANAKQMRFTLVKFDSNHQTVVYDGVKLKHVEALNNDTYTPGAMTPLNDACVKAIRRTEERVAGKDANVICVIQTDGYENASKEFTTDYLKELITAKTADGWVFSFIGAGIDATKAAADRGVSLERTMSYAKTDTGTRETFGALAANTRAYAATGDAGQVSFSDAQRDKSGDIYGDRSK